MTRSSPVIWPSRPDRTGAFRDQPHEGDGPSLWREPHQKAALYIGRNRRSLSCICPTTPRQGAFIHQPSGCRCRAQWRQGACDTDGLHCQTRFALRLCDGDDLPAAFSNAYACDPLAAFGGIVALNQQVDKATAETITGIDSYWSDRRPRLRPRRLELLRTRWKNVRLLTSARWVALGQQKAPVLFRSQGSDDAQDRRRVLVQQRDLLGSMKATGRSSPPGSPRLRRCAT